MLDAHLRAIVIFKSKTKYLGYDLGGAARYWAGKHSLVVFEQGPLKAVLDLIFFYDSYVESFKRQMPGCLEGEGEDHSVPNWFGGQEGSPG